MYPTIKELKPTVTFEIEKLMEAMARMRDETVYHVKSSNADHDCRLAWYYCQLGVYDLAREMGWITEAEREWFYAELERLAPVDQEPALGPALEEDDEPEYDPLRDLMNDRANELGVIVQG